MDHLNESKVVNSLHQSDYFGEVSLFMDCPRTATVRSTNYCTMASLTQKIFHNLTNMFPNIKMNMKKNCLKYQDDWKTFKTMLLRQVDYFEGQDSEFLQEV